MVEGRDVCNLPMGVVVNRAMVTPKRSKKVPVILANTNSYNIWIRQPLLAADVVEVESCPWDYQTILSREDKNIKVFLLSSTSSRGTGGSLCKRCGVFSRF